MSIINESFLFYNGVYLFNRRIISIYYSVFVIVKNVGKVCENFYCMLLKLLLFYVREVIIECILVL